MSESIRHLLLALDCCDYALLVVKAVRTATVTTVKTMKMWQAG